MTGESARAAAQTTWRNPAGVTSWWESPTIPNKLLKNRTIGPWWDLLEELNVTLIASREYENFLIGLTGSKLGPKQTYLPIPHPSGITYNAKNRIIYAACTRNPNQILQLRPMQHALARTDSDTPTSDGTLMPTRTDFLPGCAYLHDLVLESGQLLANAVGMNAVVKINDHELQPIWWPKAIEQNGKPDFSRNHLQLNSIALREGLARAAFSASTPIIGTRKPGQRNFSVDKKGVIFDAASREVAVTGLTRPHSARFDRDTLWVNNSGYGQLGIANLKTGKFESIFALESWTRGLAIVGSIAFVGLSRVLPHFEQYAPGLQAKTCRCGIAAVNLTTGKTIARIIWPAGNQIFAIEAVPTTVTPGFALSARTTPKHLKTYFYSASTTSNIQPTEHP